MHTHTAAAGQRMQLGFDFFAPRLWPAENKVLLQAGLIILWSSHCDFLRSKKTMTLCVIPGLNVGERKRDLLTVQDRNDPPNRPDESRALRPSPNHRPRPRNLADYFRQDVSQNFGGGFSENYLLHRNAFALRTY